MMEKHFHFLFAFLILLFGSFARSEIEVNSLQIDVNCSTITDECDTKNAFCNSDNKCQCLFGYSPVGNTCEPFQCGHLGVPTCSQLYNSPYATCDGVLSSDKRCRCFDGFHLNRHTQKCVLEKPDTHRLGGHCVADHQCGLNAECTTTSECRCPAGRIPETEFTCTQPKCFSTEFCHKNVTLNTVCDNNDVGNCTCQGPIFEQDSDTFECVRRIQKLGDHCDRETPCGEGAGCTTGSKPICKCLLGYEATSDTVCEKVHCAKDEHCQKTFSPLTTCHLKGNRKESYCDCKEGYYSYSLTFECRPEAPNIGEPCAETRYCGKFAECDKDKKCACKKGYEASKEIPWRCKF